MSNISGRNLNNFLKKLKGDELEFEAFQRGKSTKLSTFKTGITELNGIRIKSFLRITNMFEFSKHSQY